MEKNKSFILKLKRNKLNIAIIFSLFLHFFLLNTKPYLQKELTKKPEKKRVKIALLDEKELKPKKKKNQANKKLKKIKTKQIVNNELNGKEIKPEDTRFLGEKNQKYDRQTSAKKVSKFNEAGKGIKNGIKKMPIQVAKTKKVSKRKPNKNPSLSSLGLRPRSKRVFEKELEKSRIEVSNRLGVKNGKASKSGLASNNDYINDLPLGDMTNLNTVEFKFYGFYHRIRQKLEQYWGNTLKTKAELLHKSGRSIASKDHLTSLTIVINDKGKIVNIIIDSTSGVKELDDAAVESFNRAGPFPNPPNGMMNAQGVAEIKWGFVVKT